MAPRARELEEAIVNALVAGEEAVGVQGRRVLGLPRERIAQLVAAAISERSDPKG